VDWCYWDYPLIELAGMTYGLLGCGNIGIHTAEIAKALGMNVITYDGRQREEALALGVEYVELDELFASVARKKMRETYISAVYLTGSGFHDKWIDKSKNVVCDGRLVFMGQNIYTKGACYHARFGAYEADRNIVFRTKEFITQDIGVMIGEVGGRSRFYPIVTGGREWYNMKGSITLFLDDTNRLEMSYKDRISGEAQKDVIEIHGLPKRPPKTTKLTLNVELYDEKSGAIIIKDTGFGNIYPTTNKIYRREISWAE
jgi:hypothetical protein